jgi:hypothetical protein
MQNRTTTPNSHQRNFLDSLVSLDFLEFPTLFPMAHREKSTVSKLLKPSQHSGKTPLKKERLPNTRTARCAIPKSRWLRF